MHDDLMDRCNKVGCRMSDFVKASIEFCLYGYAEFDFGDEVDEGKSDKTEKNETPPHTPRIHYMEHPTD